jgi:hypothetical protein
MVGKTYQIKINQNALTFITTSFKPEKESVLHKGVYTKEFSAILFASAAGIFTYFVIRLVWEEVFFIHSLIIALVLVLAFLGAAKFIFKEQYLEVIFDKTKNTVLISRSGLFKKKAENIPLDSVQSLTVGSKKFTPENIDGIRFVERISLQHGSAMPGFGEEEEFITLSLSLSDGSERTIYAGKVKDEPEIPLREIKKFLRL